MNNKNRSVLALGYFAALHAGHRSLISFAQNIADKNDAPLSVVTFDDGMYQALGRNFREIYVLREREMILQELGVKNIEVLPVTKDFLNQSPEDFLKFLSDKNPLAIVVGADYTFGKFAAGDAELLKRFFEKSGIPVYVHDLLTVDGEKISSTMIGKLLSAGKIERTNEILGSPFFISGVVEKGFENGKKIGFPTLNLAFDEEKYIPKCGVYASRTTIDGVVYDSMTNVGPHPTLTYEKINAETHVFGLEKELYGTFIKVELLLYIRDVKKFSSLDELGSQLQIDKKRVLEVLYD